MAFQREHFTRHITYTSDEVRIFGDHGLDRGTFSFTVAQKEGGDAGTVTGKYLLLYRRQAGTWKVAVAMEAIDEDLHPPT